MFGSAFMPLALITGAARRIGATIATVLAGSGFDIALHVNSSQKQGEAMISSLRQKSINAQLFRLDLAHTEKIESMYETIVKSMGPVNLVINNACMFDYDCPQKFDANLAQKLYQVNVLAPVEMTRCLAENISGEGVAVNLLDNKLFSLNPDYFSYTLSKAALKSATEMMAMAYAKKIRVNAIAPGVTLASGDQSPENFKQSWRKSLSGTGATPEDIASTILHIWNTKSINGETIVLDGGQRHMRLARDVAFLSDK